MGSARSYLTFIRNVVYYKTMLRPVAFTKPKRLSARTKAHNQKAAARPSSKVARARVNADSGRAKVRKSRPVY